MKVYTHYYKLADNEGLRWRTLLQFGSSFDIIGSVVMMNPGSSKPIDSKIIDNKRVLFNLSKFDETNDAWYEFTVDRTMGYVAVLFASYYGLDSVSQLDGVIQVFNLFYIMDPDLSSAMRKLTMAGLPSNFQTPNDLLIYDINHLVYPVYLGFGALAFNPAFRESAKQYFDAVINSGFSAAYLDKDYSKNKFYHPRYLLGYGRNNKNSLLIRGRFKQTPMSDEQIANGVPVPKGKMSKVDQIEIIQDLKLGFQNEGLSVFQFNPKDIKTIRFELPANLQLTVTATGSGYMAVRHKSIPKGFDYSTDSYCDKEWLEDLLINIFGFDGGTKAWIGTKSLDDIGSAENIFHFIKKFVGHKLFQLSPTQRRFYLQSIKAQN